VGLEYAHYSDRIFQNRIKQHFFVIYDPRSNVKIVCMMMRKRFNCATDEFQNAREVEVDEQAAESSLSEIRNDERTGSKSTTQ
jgi:hypothetical protein